MREIEIKAHASDPERVKAFFTSRFGEGRSVNAFEFWQNELNNSGLQQYQAYVSQHRRNGKIWRLADKTLPVGSRRRELAKKLYHTLFG